MSKFVIFGEDDPFLHVELAKGEKIFAESGAMVAMDSVLDLEGKARGGLWSAVTRKVTNGESFFQQSVVATRGNGEILMAPNLPGGVEILELGSFQYRLNDGAFLAAESSAQLVTKVQGVGKALFGGTGGFFILETKGFGKLAVAGFGSIHKVDVEPGSDLIIDNYHVVAWDATLDYNISESTAKKGFLGGLLNSMLSGEGLVNRFSGTGKVIVCSRNRAGFLSWIGSAINPKK